MRGMPAARAKTEKEIGNDLCRTKIREVVHGTNTWREIEGCFTNLFGSSAVGEACIGFVYGDIDVVPIRGVSVRGSRTGENSTDL